MAVGSNTLGLLFKIGVDASEAKGLGSALQGPLDQIKNSVSDLGKSFKEAGDSFLSSFGGSAAVLAGVGAAAVAVSEAVDKAVKATVDLGSALHDLSLKTGIAVEDLNALRIVAATSSSSIEELSSAFVRFQRAAAEGGPKVQQALERFGITADQVAKDSTAAFDQFLKNFNELPASAQRTADVMAIFGRGAAALIPTFSDLNDGIEGARKKAEELGIQMSTETAAAADALGDQLQIIRLQVEGLAVALSRDLLPALKDLVQVFSDLIPVLGPIVGLLGKILTILLDINPLRIYIREWQFLKQLWSDFLPPPVEPSITKGILDGAAAWKLYGEGVERVTRASKAHKVALDDETEAQRQLRLELEKAQKELDAQQKKTGDIIIQNMEEQLKGLNQAILAAGDPVAFAKWKFSMVDFANFMTKEIDGIVQDLARLGGAVPGGGGVGGIPGAPPEIPLPKPAVGGFFEDLHKTLGQSINEFQTWGDIVGGILAQFAQAAEQAFAAFILTGKFGGQIFKQLVAQIIASLAIESAIKAIFQLAEGFASLAAGDFRGAALHFTSAEIYGGVAIAAGVAGAIIGARGGLGGDTAGAAAGGGGFGGSSAQPTPVTINQGAGGPLGIQMQQLNALNNISNKLDTASPGDVLTRGADQNPMVIGQANNEASRRDGSISREFLQISGLRTA